MTSQVISTYADGRAAGRDGGGWAGDCPRQLTPGLRLAWLDGFTVGVVERTQQLRREMAPASA